MIKKGARLLLKVSGEALGGGHPGFSAKVLTDLCTQIRDNLDYQWVIVPGGGNFFRGAHQAGFRRCVADQMGMLATAMNALALQETLQKLGVESVILSCGVASGVGEVYSCQRAWQVFAHGHVVILCGGTGSGFLTTDTASVLRACELGCDYVLKGTSVGGIYDSDPKVNSAAAFLSFVDFQEALECDLQVMDKTAFTLAQEYQKPIVVFSITQPCGLQRLLENKGQFSVVGPSEDRVCWGDKRCI
jgi:uridylate kinase